MVTAETEQNGAERCLILRQINQRLQDLACRRADILVLEITSTDDSHKIFGAVKAVKSTPRPPSLSVQDPEGKFLHLTKRRLTPSVDGLNNGSLTYSSPTAPFVGLCQSLKQPITASEVESAMKLLQNDHAVLMMLVMNC